jgi:DNA-binding GntR family transcriptional regulator
MKSDGEPSEMNVTRSPLIKRSSLHDEVVNALRDMIVTGQLEPGERIIEKDLSQQLGVSRTPIREAIKTLVLDGLIDSPPHRGAQVKPLEADEIKSLFDVIAVLEALAAQRAAEALKPGELRKLETKHRNMRAAFEEGNRARYFDLNSEIHGFLMQRSGNEILFETHSRLMLRANRGRYLAILADKRWSEAMEQHEDLMKALRAGDSEVAFEIWRNHLKLTGEALLASLKPTADL